MTALREAALKLGTAPLTVTDGVKALKGLDAGLPANIKRSKFDHSVEIAVRLGVDPKQADQIVRGSIVLPHGIGKSKRVLVFCQGNNVEVAGMPGRTSSAAKTWRIKLKAAG